MGGGEEGEGEEGGQGERGRGGRGEERRDIWNKIHPGYSCFLFV